MKSRDKKEMPLNLIMGNPGEQAKNREVEKKTRPGTNPDLTSPPEKDYKVNMLIPLWFSTRAWLKEQGLREGFRNTNDFVEHIIAEYRKTRDI